MSAATPLPWYRHFWPWFVLGLLGVSVAGSLTTVYIAVSDRDPEVRDTWSADAKSVTRDDAPERLARDLGLGASVVVEGAGQTLRVTLHGPPAAASSQIVVHLVHPTLEQRDLELTLERSADGSYRGALPRRTLGRYQLAIEGRTIATPGADAADWRLGDRIDLVPGAPVTVGRPPEPAAAGDARGDSRSDSRSSSQSSPRSDGTSEG